MASLWETTEGSLCKRGGESWGSFTPRFRQGGQSSNCTRQSAPRSADAESRPRSTALHVWLIEISNSTQHRTRTGWAGFHVHQAPVFYHRVVSVRYGAVYSNQILGKTQRSSTCSLGRPRRCQRVTSQLGRYRLDSDRECIRRWQRQVAANVPATLNSTVSSSCSE